MATREEQKRETRERLLTAAAQCFARKGYASCSVGDIAESAGLARGALYGHFAGKEELFIELICGEHGQGLEKARQTLEREPSLAGILAILESCIRDVGFPVDHRLWTEILAVTARDEHIRAAFAASDAAMRAVFTELLEAAARRGEIDADLDFEAVSVWLYALTDGLIARTADDPAFDVERHLALFSSLVRRALQPRNADGAGNAREADGTAGLAGRTGSGTLRLVYPQWQGGYDMTEFPGQVYPFGARLLAWLAPRSTALEVEVPLPAWQPVREEDVPRKGGVLWEDQIVRQTGEAQKLLCAHRPDRVITFGGDCLVSLAPFGYLNERYAGDLGIVWIDAHPDISTPRDFDHAHAMVLGSLLGEGEPALAAMVGRHVRPDQVTLVSVDRALDYEEETLARLGGLGLARVSSSAIRTDSAALLDSLAARGLKRVAIHLDLDCLDPAFFKSLLFTNPDVPNPIESEHGKLTLNVVSRLLQDLAAHTEVVGMTFAEYMPWDALNLRRMLHALPFLR